MKISITDIEVTINEGSLNAVVELINACAKVEAQKHTIYPKQSGKSKEATVEVEEVPADEEGQTVANEASVEETPKPKKTRTPKTQKVEKPKTQEAQEDDTLNDGEELSDDELQKLNSMSEYDLREEIKRLVPLFKAKVGLSKLKKIVENAGGTDGKVTRPSLIPADNLVGVVRALSSELE